MLKNIFVVFTLIFLFLNSPLFAHPFEVGEKLSYTIKFMGISAGVQTLHVENIIESEGNTLYGMSYVIRSTGIASLFFKMEDKIESHVNVETLYPQFVRVRISENNRVEHVEVRITKEEDSLRATIHDKKRGTERIEKIPVQPLDIVSLIYWIRSQELEVGNKFNVLLLDTLGGFEEMQFEVSGVDKAYTYIGTFSAFVCEQMGTDEPIKVWFSQDERRLPLYVQITTPFGLLTAVLRSVEY